MNWSKVMGTLLLFIWDQIQRECHFQSFYICKIPTSIRLQFPTFLMWDWCLFVFLFLLFSLSSLSLRCACVQCLWPPLLHPCLSSPHRSRSQVSWPEYRKTVSLTATFPQRFSPRHVDVLEVCCMLPSSVFPSICLCCSRHRSFCRSKRARVLPLFILYDSNNTLQ